MKKTLTLTAVLATAAGATTLLATAAGATSFEPRQCIERLVLRDGTNVQNCVLVRDNVYDCGCAGAVRPRHQANYVEDPFTDGPMTRVAEQSVDVTEEPAGGGGGTATNSGEMGDDGTNTNSGESPDNVDSTEAPPPSPPL